MYGNRVNFSLQLYLRALNMPLKFIIAAANACALCRGVFYSDELTYAGIVLNSHTTDIC